MNNEYTEADYTFREELFKNPDFTKEFSLLIMCKNDWFGDTNLIERFWEEYVQEVDGTHIEKIRQMVKDGFIHLKEEYRVNWELEV